MVLIIALEAERAVESRDFVDHLVEGLRWDLKYNYNKSKRLIWLQKNKR